MSEDSNSSDSDIGEPASGPADDFPFYNKRPVEISGGQWWFVFGMVILGFAVLVAPISPIGGQFEAFLRAILFFALPLGGLIYVAPRHWKAIFRPVGFREVGWMVAFALLNLVASVAMGLVVRQFVETSTNPAAGILSESTPAERVLFFLKTIPQLFGEEMITIPVFLGLMYWAYSKLNLSRTKALILAWLISAVFFGLVHLDSYNWNIVQCLCIIGTARLMLTLAYIKTKNIWVSTGAHILNDWLILGSGLLGSSVGGG